MRTALSVFEVKFRYCSKLFLISTFLRHIDSLPLFPELAYHDVEVLSIVITVAENVIIRFQIS